MIPELLFSFGIEIEFNRATQSSVSRFLSNNNIPARVTYDVSAQEILLRDPIFNIPIRGDLKGFNVQREKFGGEIVTDILNFRKEKDYFLKLVKILRFLESNGEHSASSSAGVHFHIDYPRVLEALKNFMLVSANLEKFWYSIGGLGYQHRASKSDSVYYRPITGVGPLAVPVSRKEFTHCFQIETLVKSRNLEEFFQSYGDSSGNAGASRYPPVRYHYVNLYNMLGKRKTAEIRIFNTSMNPVAIWIALKLYWYMLKYCATASPYDIVKDSFIYEHSVFKENEESFVDDTLPRIIKAFKIKDQNLINYLEKLVSSTKEITLNERIVRSHLHDRQRRVPIHWYGLETIPYPLLSFKSIKHPVYFDSYTLSGEIKPQSMWSSLTSMLQASTQLIQKSPHIKEYAYKRREQFNPYEEGDY